MIEFGPWGCDFQVPASGVPPDEDGQALFGGAADYDDNRRAIVDFATGGRNSGVWLDYKVARSRETTSRDVFADYLLAWTQTNFVDELKGFELPVLVLFGEHDQALTREVMEQTYLTWLPNVEMTMIGNAGHYPMDEAPVNLATCMEALMREHSS